MRRLLIILLLIPVICFGQNRGERDRVNPVTSDCAGYGFRGHWETATPDTTPATSFPVYDYDGNGYDTVVIGTQTWLASNLRTTHYSDGTAMPKVTDASAWAALTTGGYCWYNNDSATYFNNTGALYNWYIASSANVCPTGWHVPTDMEICALINYYDGFVDCPTIEAFDQWGTISTSAGGNITSSPFLLKYDGTRGPTGTFGLNGSQAFLYTQSAHSSTYGTYYLNQSSAYLNMGRQYGDKRQGRSIRCLKD